VHHVDAGAQLEQLAGKVWRGAGARRGPVELAGICPRPGDQLGHGPERRLRRNHEGVGGSPDHRDRHKILEGIVARLSIEARIDDVSAGADQQRVAVGRCAGRGRNADIAARAAAVLHDHRLAQCIAELRIDQTRSDIGPAAGGEAGDQGDLALRILRARDVGAGTHGKRRGGNEARERQRAPSSMPAQLLGHQLSSRRCCFSGACVIMTVLSAIVMRSSGASSMPCGRHADANERERLRQP
jgi:hypothetical protein